MHLCLWPSVQQRQEARCCVFMEDTSRLWPWLGVDGVEVTAILLEGELHMAWWLLHIKAGGTGTFPVLPYQNVQTCSLLPGLTHLF